MKIKLKNTANGKCRWIEKNNNFPIEIGETLVRHSKRWGRTESVVLELKK